MFATGFFFGVKSSNLLSARESSKLKLHLEFAFLSFGFYIVANFVNYFLLYKSVDYSFKFGTLDQFLNPLKKDLMFLFLSDIFKHFEYTKIHRN